MGIRGVWEVYGVIWSCRDGTLHGIPTNKNFVPPLQLVGLEGVGET